MKTPLCKSIHMYTQTNQCLVTEKMSGLVIFAVLVLKEFNSNVDTSKVNKSRVVFCIVSPTFIQCGGMLLGNPVCVFDVPLFLFSPSPFPMTHFASFGMQRAASANAVTKGAGSEGGACEAFDV